RLLWVTVQLLAAWGVVFIIMDVWEEYLNSPTVTTVDSTSYPIWNVPFPAIAVCNINKVSRSATWKLAQKLSKSRNVSAEELFPMLQYLGRLYDHDPDNTKAMQKLHSILAEHNQDVDTMMKELTPRCEDLLVRCRWMGRGKSCKEMFKMRKSMEGYCCVFNYIRPTDNFDDDDESRNVTVGERLSAPGYHMGLTVLLDPQPDDYYYPLLSSYGAKVLVFNPGDFPDTPSGGLIEKLVPPKTEVFFRLEATSVYAEPIVKSFDRKQRGCLFSSELSLLFGDSYSYSDCLMNCRIRSIHTLCGCLPFYFPVRGRTRKCNLLDVPCLHKYREKWSTLRPTENIPGLGAEMQESISCEECSPACSDTTYHVQTSSAHLSQTPYLRSGFIENISLKNHSVFHLYFGSRNTLRLKQDVLYYWYDLLSNFGGICGLFVGFSLISIVEFVYFFTLRLFFAARGAEDKNSGKNIDSANKIRGLGARNRDIYWREIIPRQDVTRY
ncbi:hypothetical protein B7P43_G14391, partial [Cryptotermes secundus]